MAETNPQFHLRRLSEGAGDRLEIQALAVVPGHPIPRRQFLARGLGVAAALAAMEGGSVVDVLAGEAPGVPRVVFAHTGSVTGLAFSPDGKTLVSSSGDGTVKVWDIAECKLVHTLPKNSSPVAAVALASGATRVLAATEDRRVSVWRLPDAAPDFAYKQHASGVQAIAVSPAGVAASGSADGEIHLWSLADGTPLGRIAGDGKGIKRLAMTPDGRTLVSGGQSGKLRFYQLPAGTLTEEVRGHVPEVRAVAASRNGKYVIAGGSDKFVSIRTVAGPADATRLAGHQLAVNDAAITSDNSLLASVSEDCAARLWTLPAGEIFGQLCGPFPLRSAAISADDSLLATGDIHGVITFWDLRSRQVLGFLFDPRASAVPAIIYHVDDPVTRRRITYTVAEGTPLPSGATCTCNTVPGELETAEEEDEADKPRPKRRETPLPNVPRVGPTREEIAKARQASKAKRDAKREERLRLQEMLAAQYYYSMQRYLAARPSLSGRWCTHAGWQGSGSGTSSTTVCTCNQVCTCDTVCTT